MSVFVGKDSVSKEIPELQRAAEQLGTLNRVYEVIYRLVIMQKI